MSLVRVTRSSLVVCGAVFLTMSCSSDDGQNRAVQQNVSSLEELDERISYLESRLERPAAFRAVVDNELQYTRGIDRHDEDLIEGALWPDADVSYGEKVSMTEMAEWANEEHAKKAAHQHHVTSISLDVEKDMAHAESYVIYSSDLPRDTSKDMSGTATPGRVPPEAYATLGAGRYLNRYHRRGQEWRIQVHEYIHNISMRLEVVDLCASACIGRWDTSDISYLRPLETLSMEERQRRNDEGRTPRSPN